MRIPRTVGVLLMTAGLALIGLAAAPVVKARVAQARVQALADNWPEPGAAVEPSPTADDGLPQAATVPAGDAATPNDAAAMAAEQAAIRAAAMGRPAPSAPPSVPSRQTQPPAPTSPRPAWGAPIAAKKEYKQGDPVFRLEIAKIGLRSVVVYGTSDEALNRGPGLVERTAFPGRPGNTVVAAHRDYYFWGLGDLTAGDQIRVSAPDGVWTYIVTGRRVVKETQTEILDATPQPTLTLFTCWPLIYAGHTPDRLVITATRSDFVNK